jgi:D-alanyl-D-alanine carboxypeptidase (penicillin-binding protein 5/6)
LPAPPQVAAKAYLLIDAESGRVITESEADTQLEPASLTKIMTAYTVFREIENKNLTLEEAALVSEKSWRMGGSKMFIEVGKQIAIADLIRGMIIQSGNDACIALAEHIAGSEDSFASLMNQHGKRLGMTDTHFANSSGWPDANHYTTARDLSKVAIATIRDFPELYKIYGEKEFVFNGITQHNRNKLLWRDSSVDGMKTGHTEGAGYGLVAAAKREEMRLIAVVMGTSGEEARAQAAMALLNYGFRFFETHKLHGAGEALQEMRVWKGEASMLQVGLGADLYVTVPRKEYPNLQARSELTQPLMGPVAKGQQVGKLILELNGARIQEVPIVALQEVPEAGFFGSLWDSAMLWFE